MVVAYLEGMASLKCSLGEEDCLVPSHTHTLSLTESSQLQLDDGDEKVRAIPEKRCVLILREIPKNTPKEVSFKSPSSAISGGLVRW